MHEFYTVIENQMSGESTFGMFYFHFLDYKDALAKYYTLCAAAVQTEIPYHSVHILQSDGKIRMQEIFDRREFEPTPVDSLLS